MVRNWPRSVCIGIAAGCAARIVFSWKTLPSNVASHFGADGRANGFQSRDSFLALSLGMLALMLTLFLGLPWLLRRMPANMINIPNRAYWLTEERRADALEKLSHHLGVIGVLTLAFMTAVYELVIRANLAGSALDGSTLMVLLATLYAGIIMRIVLIYRDFRLPKNAR